MSLHAKRNVLVLIMLFLCTITIIGTNYIFSKKIATDIHEMSMENEYKKIGGKENYVLLQELQKREIMGYINKIKEEQPELVEEILKKESKYKILNNEIINDLKKDTSIFGNTGSLITFIEFSDMECDFCIKQHSKGITEKILEKFDGKVNYIFKNFPLPIHENSEIKAISTKCIEKISSKENYLDFIDKLFKDNNLDITSEALKYNINKNDFELCLNNKEIKEVIQKEFTQGRMLGIESVPANLIINNETLEYIILSEESDYEDIEKVIIDISE